MFPPMMERSMVKELGRSGFRDYGIPWRGHPALHEEIAWFATDDDRVLGVVIRDRVDNDFSWVLLAHASIPVPEDDSEISASGYRAVTLKVSRPTQATATAELHEAMQRLAQGGAP
jgi:hypothetical protein